jgi:hypothetical protein
VSRIASTILKAFVLVAGLSLSAGAQGPPPPAPQTPVRPSPTPPQQIPPQFAQAQIPQATNAVFILVFPGLVNFRLAPSGVSSGSSPVFVLTAWNLAPNVSQLTLYAYFTSGTAALTGPGAAIPSSRVSGTNAQGTFQPFTGTSPFPGGGSITLFVENILGARRRQLRIDTLNLRIDTTGLALSPGSYNGLLHLQVQAL